MNWKRLLAYATGSVDDELLRRNEYLVTENRILRNQIKGRIRLTDTERISLAQVAQRLGRRALEEVAQIVRPETVLAWHRRLIARKSHGSKQRRAPKLPKVSAIEELVIQLAQQSPNWGYRRIAGGGELVRSGCQRTWRIRHEVASYPQCTAGFVSFGTFSGP